MLFDRSCATESVTGESQCRSAQRFDLARTARGETGAEYEIAIGRLDLREFRTEPDRERARGAERPRERDGAAAALPAEDVRDAATLDEQARAQGVERAEEPGLREVGAQRAADLAVEIAGGLEQGETGQGGRQQIRHPATDLQPPGAALEAAARPPAFEVQKLGRADAEATANAVDVAFVDLHPDIDQRIDALRIAYFAYLRVPEDFLGEEIALATQQRRVAEPVTGLEREHPAHHGGIDLRRAHHIDRTEPGAEAGIEVVADARLVGPVVLDGVASEDLGPREAAVPQPAPDRVARRLIDRDVERIAQPERKATRDFARQVLGAGEQDLRDGYRTPFSYSERDPHPLAVPRRIHADDRFAEPVLVVQEPEAERVDGQHPWVQVLAIDADPQPAERLHGIAARRHRDQRGAQELRTDRPRARERDRRDLHGVDRDLGPRRARRPERGPREQSEDAAVQERAPDGNARDPAHSVASACGRGAQQPGKRQIGAGGRVQPGAPIAPEPEPCRARDHRRVVRSETQSGREHTAVRAERTGQRITQCPACRHPTTQHHLRTPRVPHRAHGLGDEHVDDRLLERGGEVRGLGLQPAGLIQLAHRVSTEVLSPLNENAK